MPRNPLSVGRLTTADLIAEARLDSAPVSPAARVAAARAIGQAMTPAERAAAARNRMRRNDEVNASAAHMLNATALAVHGNRARLLRPDEGGQ